MIIIRIKLVKQEDTYDCGIACLLTIIRYYKSDASKDYLKEISNTTKQGTTMYGLILAAEKLGFKAVGKTGSVENINKKNIPLVAHIKINEKKGLYHYVIISHITNKKITIKDPSNGTKELTKEEFKKITTNNYLFIYKTEKTKIIRKQNIIKKSLKTLFKKNKKIIIIGIIIILINIILELLNLFSLKIILNNAITVEYLMNLKKLLIIFLYLLILKTFSTFIIKIINQKLTTQISYLLKTNLINHLLSLPYLYYKEKEKGTILSLFKDIDILTNYLISSYYSLFYSCSLLIFIYSYFFSLSTKLTIVLIISSMILILIISKQKKISKKIINKFYKEEDNYNNNLNLIINNNEKIKGLHLENNIINKMKYVINNNLIYNYKLNKFKNGLEHLMTLFEGIIYFIIIFLGGTIIITTKELSLSTFLLLESLIFINLKNIESIYLIIIQYENYKVIKERLNNIFYYEKEKLLTNNKYDYKTKKITIDIRNLSFKYYDNLILDNINLTINPKDKIFIYGESGSGKSTLVKLLGRYIPVKYNKIKINDIDITHYNLESLRTIVKYITEDDMISNSSIKDNIYLSRKPRINQKELLKITGINKMFKEKHYNINTNLEENGNNLSKGEKSRINLAQALFEPSEIYIFDECLSNIDISLEKRILKNILEFYKDKIIIYISHRTTNKDLFNRTIYMEKGKCYEKSKL